MSAGAYPSHIDGRKSRLSNGMNLITELCDIHPGVDWTLNVRRADDLSSLKNS